MDERRRTREQAANRQIDSMLNVLLSNAVEHGASRHAVLVFDDPLNVIVVTSDPPLPYFAKYAAQVMVITTPWPFEGGFEKAVRPTVKLMRNLGWDPVGGFVVEVFPGRFANGDPITLLGANVEVVGRTRELRGYRLGVDGDAGSPGVRGPCPENCSSMFS